MRVRRVRRLGVSVVSPADGEAEEEASVELDDERRFEAPVALLRSVLVRLRLVAGFEARLSSAAAAELSCSLSRFSSRSTAGGADLADDGCSSRQAE